MGSGASRFCLRIAGLGLGFECDSPGIISILRRRYAPFLGRECKKGRSCLFRTTPAERKDLPFKPGVSMKAGFLNLRRGDFRASLDLRAGVGALSVAPGEQCLDAFLRSLISALLLRSGGLMLHSAGLVRGGKAHIFLGRSGAGKSTLSRLAAGAGAEVVSDEINMLRRVNGRWRVYGSPFWGEMRAAGRPGSWPLGGIYLLSKARANRLLPCGKGGALGLLLRCLLNFEKGPEVSRLVLQNASRLLVRARCGKLEFSKRDASFLELI